MLLRTTIFIPFVAVFPRKSHRSRKLKEAVFEWYSSDAVGCDAKYTCFRGHSKTSYSIDSVEVFCFSDFYAEITQQIE